VNPARALGLDEQGVLERPERGSVAAGSLGGDAELEQSGELDGGDDVVCRFWEDGGGRLLIDR
jgi:hypothetical protein